MSCVTSGYSASILLFNSQPRYSNIRDGQSGVMMWRGITSVTYCWLPRICKDYEDTDVISFISSNCTQWMDGLMKSMSNHINDATDPPFWWSQIITNWMCSEPNSVLYWLDLSNWASEHEKKLAVRLGTVASCLCTNHCENDKTINTGWIMHLELPDKWKTWTWCFHSMIIGEASSGTRSISLEL